MLCEQDTMNAIKLPYEEEWLYTRKRVNSLEREIVCNASKHHVDMMMPDLLRECIFDVHGYDRRADEYWGKKQGQGIEAKYKIQTIQFGSEDTLIRFYYNNTNQEEWTNMYNKVLEIAEIAEVLEQVGKHMETMCAQ